jgi:hypothetical protein
LICLASLLAGCTFPDARAQGTCGDPDVAVDEADALFKSAVNQNGGVAYAKITGPLRPQLERAVGAFKAVCKKNLEAQSRPAQMAFWINAYNLFTLQQIARHFPLESIRDIGILPGAAWRDAFIELPALRRPPLALDDIEHGILRGDFKERRIHFAINCASVGCPRLRPEAWRGHTLDAELERAAREFLGDKRKNRVIGKKGVALSRIFKWFRKDFAASKAALPRALLPWAQGDLARVLSSPGVKVEYADYDWRLNTPGNMAAAGQ